MTTRPSINGIPGSAYSSVIGFPTRIIDLADLCEGNIANHKPAVRTAQVDCFTFVKYGTAVRLEEAEAMYFVCEMTTVQTPN